MEENKENQINGQQKNNIDLLKEKYVEIEELKKQRNIKKAIKKIHKDKEDILKEDAAEKAKEAREKEENNIKLDASAKVLSLLDSIKNEREDKEESKSKGKKISKKKLEAMKKELHDIGKTLAIRVIYGYHGRNKECEFAVEVHSKILKNKRHTFFLENITSKNRDTFEQVKRKISTIGTLSDSTWKLLIDTAIGLINDGMFEEVEFLAGIVTSKANSVEKANYDKVYNFCIENADRFASLYSNNFNKEYHYGVKLDTPKWVKYYKGKVIWAITSDTLRYQIAIPKNDAYEGKRGNKDLYDFKKSLQAYVDWSDNKDRAGLIYTPMKDRFDSNADLEDDSTSDPDVDKSKENKKRLWCFRFCMSGRIEKEVKDVSEEDEE